MTGASNKMIAYKLGITEATVKVHLKTLLRKIDVNNRTQAAIWAMNNGFTADSAPVPTRFMRSPPERDDHGCGLFRSLAVTSGRIEHHERGARS